MRFKKNAIAACIGSALLIGSAAAQTQTDVKAVFGETKQVSSQYVIYLNDAAALVNHTKGKHNYKVEKQKIATKQTALFEQIRALDPMAKLLGNSSMLANYITVSISSEYADKLTTLANVHSVNKSAPTRMMSVKKSSIMSTSIQSTANADGLEMMAPYTGSESAGEGIDIAIISTGIDYTLAAFGGSGEYGEDNDAETPPMAGSYLDAFENGPIGPSTPEIPDDPDTPEDEFVPAMDGFGGFPTDVVVGGWDFAGENYGEDGNPIDQNIEFTDWRGYAYPTGLGTEIASIVHQLAPAAKLHAYKISNIQASSWDPTQFDIIIPDVSRVISSLEHALDPNQDGDTSDHLDIALIDAAGAAAFMAPNSIGGVGSASLVHYIIEMAAANGLTIVTHAGSSAEYSFMGESENKFRNWISEEGGATSAITVGSVVKSADSETNVVADWSPMGPVRGTKALKPEIMTFADDQVVAQISNIDPEANKLAIRTGTLTAAARIAAAAAVVKSNNPALGPIEIKALLTNTASKSGILESEGGNVAELIAMGHGIENVDAAISSPVAMWEKNSYQPYVQFGAHELAHEKRIVKNITIRNLSDSAQTYTAGYVTTGEKSGYDALTINMPSTVSIPANQSVNIAIEIAVDGTKLPEWPLQSTEDFVDEKLKETELNGYFTFSAEDKPEINLGWMITARNETSIDKHVVTDTFPKYLGWNSETGESEYELLDWAEKYFPLNEWGLTSYTALTSNFTNDSLTPTTFETYPLLIKKPIEPAGKENVAGHKIHGVGGGIYDDARCEVTGKKLSIAVNFFQPADVALANYMDKIGAPLFYYELNHESVVLDNGWDKSFNGGYVDESMQINQPFVQLNAKGQPATYYIDYNQEYDYTNPNGRFVESILPVRFSNNSNNVVSEMCLEEYFHHEIDSVADFDQNLGLHIETDRDVGVEKGEPMAQFNPIKGGYYSELEGCTVDGFGWEYCGIITTDLTSRSGFASIGADDDITTTEFNHVYTAQPGETVTIAAITSDILTYLVPEFMVMSTSDNFYQTSQVGYLDADGSILADVKAGQSFTLDEDAALYAVIGKIKLDTAGFFGIDDSDWESHDIDIVNVLPGSPFAMNQETHELYVTNPEALDYENQNMYQVQLLAKQGNTIGIPRFITVYLNNVNDVAPEVMSDALDAIPATNIVLDNESMSFSIDFTGVFVEREGDSLTYTASGAGLSALSVNGTTLSGSVTAAGSYQVMVTASDGVNEVSASIPVTVTEAEKKSSSGGIGAFAFLASLLMFRRRK
jgi:hypothetical protein